MLGMRELRGLEVVVVVTRIALVCALPANTGYPALRIRASGQFKSIVQPWGKL
jgi:hypothetical protein